MSTTLSTIEPRVLQRLEEVSATWWSTQDELYPFLVEAEWETALITGYPEVAQNVTIALTQNQTVQTAPSAAIALISLRDANGNPLYKTTPWDLDRMYPGWEAAAAVAAPTYWFPIGLTRFGIYPKVSGGYTVSAAYIANPVTTARPYTGAEVIPYLVEYQEGLVEYAAHTARMKAATVEYVNSFPAYNRFLSVAAQLSKYATRIGNLRFSFSKGAAAAPSPVSERD